MEKQPYVLIVDDDPDILEDPAAWEPPLLSFRIGPESWRGELWKSSLTS